jgi:hypothetical protein
MDDVDMSVEFGVFYLVFVEVLMEEVGVNKGSSRVGFLFEFEKNAIFYRRRSRCSQFSRRSMGKRGRGVYSPTSSYSSS